MAAAKRYPAEQIVVKLGENEKLQGQGLTIEQSCLRIGLSDQAFYRPGPSVSALRASK
jgi:hypothetical protein